MGDQLYLGNLDAEREWGFASDYVEMMVDADLERLRRVRDGQVAEIPLAR